MSPVEPSDFAPGYNAALHGFALFTCVMTFPLIFLGGLVTTQGAGLSVPDWPTSWGYNMFALPWGIWKQGGIFLEHSHRLLASAVGFLTLVLACWTWVDQPRRAVRWTALGALGLVIFQGVLGGLRVVLVNLDLAIVHACVAQAFFCLLAFFCVVTSRWWIDAPLMPAMDGKRLITLGWICVACIYWQLIIGAVMRHYQAGLAIPDIPLSYGHWIPPISAEALQDANAQRAWELGLAPVTLGQIWLHFAHRVGAVVVTILLTAISAIVIRRHRTRALLHPAMLLPGLLAVQIGLGVWTVLGRKPADVATAHVAVGALVLVTTWVLLVRSMRLYSVRRRFATLSPAGDFANAGASMKAVPST